MHEKAQLENTSGERILEEFSEYHQSGTVLDKVGAVGEVSDVSDTLDDVAETLQPDLDERDSSPAWDTDALEAPPPSDAGISEVQSEHFEKRSSSALDDGSLTCSSDSIPSVVTNGPYKKNAFSVTRASSLPIRYMSASLFLVSSVSSYIFILDGILSFQGENSAE